MTNEQILKKAIEKAVKNGFKDKFSYRHAIEKYLIFNKYYSIIFSHDFSSCFYGKEWKERLKEQVLEKEPLLYLKKFL